MADMLEEVSLKVFKIQRNCCHCVITDATKVHCSCLKQKRERKIGKMLRSAFSSENMADACYLYSGAAFFLFKALITPFPGSFTYSIMEMDKDF